MSLGEGKTVKQVSRLFNKKRQTIDYWQKKGVNNGWLERRGHYPATYRLTEKGKQRFLRRGEGVSDDGLLRVRAHGAIVSYPITVFPSGNWKERFDRDIREIPLNHWVRRDLDVGGVAVCVTEKNVLVYCQSFWIDSNDFLVKSLFGLIKSCDEVAMIICNKYGFKLDILGAELVAEPQFALADYFTGDNEKVRFWFKKGNIDFSKGYRELEYNDARYLSEFLALPEKIAYFAESGIPLMLKKGFNTLKGKKDVRAFIDMEPLDES